MPLAAMAHQSAGCGARQRPELSAQRRGQPELINLARAPARDQQSRRATDRFSGWGKPWPTGDHAKWPQAESAGISAARYGSTMGKVTAPRLHPTSS